MKVFQSPWKNILYFLYRISSPVVDPLKFLSGIYGYIWYIRDILQYKRLMPSFKIFSLSLFPMLHDKSNHPFDAHYYYQQLWVFENVLKKTPKRHIDISSSYEMSGYLSKIVKTTFVDYRPFDTNLRNLSVEQGDILDLQFEKDSVESLSCLHVIEHIGLGRYGDTLDPLGTKKSCKELVRILSKGGRLYLSTPIGKERTCFNAHRIHSPLSIIKFCKPLKLLSFTVVDDLGVLHENVDPNDFTDLHYGCGMFEFTK